MSVRDPKPGDVIGGTGLFTESRKPAVGQPPSKLWVFRISWRKQNLLEIRLEVVERAF